MNIKINDITIDMGDAVVYREFGIMENRIGKLAGATFMADGDSKLIISIHSKHHEEYGYDAIAIYPSDIMGVSESPMKKAWDMEN